MPWDKWGISVRQEVKDLQGTLIGARWESFTGPSGPAGRGVLEVDPVTEHLGEAARMIGVSIEKFQIDYQEVVSQQEPASPIVPSLHSKCTGSPVGRLLIGRACAGSGEGSRPPEPELPTCSLKVSALVQAIAALDRFGGIPSQSAHGGKPISFSTWANRGSERTPSRVGSTLIQMTRESRSSQDLRSHSNA